MLFLKVEGEVEDPLLEVEGHVEPLEVVEEVEGRLEEVEGPLEEVEGEEEDDPLEGEVEEEAVA